jgi:uncharacterized protein involved in exopolysaccharide biosynthesis
MEEKEDIITIDFKALFKILWKEKLWILLITSIFTLGGICYAFTAREEFVSEGKLLPEISGGSGNSLGGLANLIGVGGFELGMKGNTEAIRPDLYPDILKSTPFFLRLFNQNFFTKNGENQNFEKFYNLKVEGGEKPESDDLILIKVKPEGVITLNKLTENRILDLQERINANIDKKSGVISVSVKMPDPVVAASITKFAIDYMTEYVTEYRTEKIRKEVDFLGEKVASSKGKLYNIQERKALYSDQFSAPTIRLQSADVQRERIESEHKISSSFYNELLKKYEEAKIKLQQETPVFKIYNPPLVPNYKSEPRRLVIIVIFTILGFLIGAGISIFIKGNYLNLTNAYELKR